MRFMMIIKSNDKAEAGILPDEAILTQMGQFNDELIKSGALLAGEGLKASSTGARVRLSPKKPAAAATIIDGPFTETKELVAGFWLLQVKSKQEAIDWATRVPGKGEEIELRQLYELSDFPVEAGETPDGWRDQEQKWREGSPAEGTPPAQPARKPGTTRYMLFIKGGKVTESGRLPSQQSLADTGALMQEQAEKGALLGGEGLKPSASGARIKQSGSKRTVIDGPFTEAKELIAGYLIIQTATREEALDVARRMLEIHVREVEDDGEIEVRPIFELEDFPVSPEEKPDGWRDREQRFRDEKA